MKKGDGELNLFWLLPALGLTWVVVFLMFPGFSPPMSPTLSAEEVAAVYRDPANTTVIRYSMIVFNWFSVGMIPFLALIVTQIHRMAHHTPIWSYAYRGWPDAVVHGAAPAHGRLADLSRVRAAGCLFTATQHAGRLIEGRRR